MKTVITQDNILKATLSADPDSAKIVFCDEHYDRLLARLKVHGIDQFVAKDLPTLKSIVMAKRIEPMWHSQEALIELAIKSVGSEGVIQFKCPVCALNKFDFVAQVAMVMKQGLVRKPS